jgi:hypothetical protein
MFQSNDVASATIATEGKKEEKAHQNVAVVSKYFNVSNDVDTTLKDLTFTAECQDALKKLQKGEIANVLFLFPN